jgi:hypothetical protein
MCPLSEHKLKSCINLHLKFSKINLFKTEVIFDRLQTSSYMVKYFVCAIIRSKFIINLQFLLAFSHEGKYDKVLEVNEWRIYCIMTRFVTRSKWGM